jgi:hypothetical protein
VPTVRACVRVPQVDIGSYEDFVVYATRVYGSVVARALANTSAYGPPPGSAGSRYESWWQYAYHTSGDFSLTCPTRRAARLLARRKGGARTWLYTFAHSPATPANRPDPPTPDYKFGAFHGAEVPFVLGDVFEMSNHSCYAHCSRWFPALPDPAEPSQTRWADERGLSAAMAQRWTTFAATGDPNLWAGRELPWPGCPDAARAHAAQWCVHAPAQLTGTPRPTDMHAPPN